MIQNKKAVILTPTDILAITLTVVILALTYTYTVEIRDYSTRNNAEFSEEFYYPMNQKIKELYYKNEYIQNLDKTKLISSCGREIKLESSKDIVFLSRNCDDTDSAQKELVNYYLEELRGKEIQNSKFRDYFQKLNSIRENACISMFELDESINYANLLFNSNLNNNNIDVELQSGNLILPYPLIDKNSVGYIKACSTILK